MLDALAVCIPTPQLLSRTIPLTLTLFEICISSHSPVGENRGIAVGIVRRQRSAHESRPVMHCPIPAVVRNPHDDLPSGNHPEKVTIRCGDIEEEFVG